jgi:hypothetical protein
LVVGTYSESETGMAQPSSTTTHINSESACYFGPESQDGNSDGLVPWPATLDLRVRKQ